MRITREDLNSLIRLQRYISSRDITRHNIMGIMIQKMDNGVFAIATDGYTLVKLAVDFPEEIIPEKGFCIRFPFATVKAQQRFGESFNVVKKDDIIMFRPEHPLMGDNCIILATIEFVDFPDWQRVVPVIKPPQGVLDIGLNAKYISNISRAFGTELFRFSMPDTADCPVLMYPLNQPKERKSFGLVMPTRL